MRGVPKGYVVIGSRVPEFGDLVIVGGEVVEWSGEKYSSVVVTLLGVGSEGIELDYEVKLAEDGDVVHGASPGLHPAATVIPDICVGTWCDDNGRSVCILGRAKENGWDAYIPEARTFDHVSDTGSSDFFRLVRFISKEISLK